MALYPSMCHSQIQLEMVKSKGMKVPEGATGENSHDLRVGEAIALPFTSPTFNTERRLTTLLTWDRPGVRFPQPHAAQSPPQSTKERTARPAALRPLAPSARSPRHGPPQGTAGSLSFYFHTRTNVGTRVPRNRGLRLAAEGGPPTTRYLRSLLNDKKIRCLQAVVKRRYVLLPLSKNNQNHI